MGDPRDPINLSNGPLLQAIAALRDTINSSTGELKDRFGDLAEKVDKLVKADNDQSIETKILSRDFDSYKRERESATRLWEEWKKETNGVIKELHDQVVTWKGMTAALIGLVAVGAGIVGILKALH